MNEYSTPELKSKEAISEYRKIVWKEYVQENKKDKSRIEEVENCIMCYGDVKMRYGLQIFGKPDEKGYPLYICLHGGGQSDTPDINNSQWNHMYIYYTKGVKNGVYINPRGVRDTWDTHANPESYPLYDRLIENMILFKNVDPNRVYILGFSAGGDGVYMVAPRMADRFAAANMSAGHHNGTSVTNMYNTPFQLQVGELDTAYNRHRVTVEYDLKLDQLHKQYNGGYIHNVYVHYQKGHNFYDNSLELQRVIADNEAWLNGDETKATKEEDTNAIHFLDRYTRNPLPERIVWDLGNRAELRKTTSFYWLKAAKTVQEGEIVASFHKNTNTVVIERATDGIDFSILLNEEMVNLFSPITVITPKGTFQVKAQVSPELIWETTRERGDVNYQFAAEIVYSNLK